VMVPFEEVVAEHSALVWRVCRAVLSDAEADDAWSETFVSALRAYPDLRPDSNVTGWLVTIAHRKAIDIHRARSRRPVPIGSIPEQAASAEASAMDEDLAAALLALPPKQREAVVQHHLAGQPYAEVAASMDISIEAARRNAADGIAALRRTLGR
jgi:RNA polymerase sigma factor (sigma-70 family)